MEEKYFSGIGRRKTALARVRLYPAEKTSVIINKKEIEKPVDFYLEPLKITNFLNQFRIEAKTRGGGIRAQKEAIRLGISRALLKKETSLKSTLRKAGLITRDPRMVERKKPGLKKARRAPQWTKR